MIPALVSTGSRGPRWLLILPVAAAVALPMVTPAGAAPGTSSGEHLRRALTFHASFDRGPEADFALGDRVLYSAPAMVKRDGIKAGLPGNGDVSIVNGEGRFGAGLRFHRKSAGMIFYEAARNVAYRTNGWDGTVSFWLSLTPDEDLEPGYTDPIQITPRAWNDAAFFVEFTKDEKPREFRLGAYADFKVWNPANRDWGKIPFEEKPLVKVERPPFRRDQWTHVVFTFRNYNTGRNDGVTALYLNGRRQGSLGARRQTFTWDPGKTMVMLGLSYIGRFDELALFNRALTDEEVAAVHQLPDGIRSLGKL